MNKTINLNNYDSILIYSLNYIGDTLFTNPVYLALKNLNPKIKIIAIVGNKGGYQILKNNPYVDSIIKIKGNFFTKLKTIKKNLSVIPKIAIILESSFEAALICFMLGIKNRIGMPTQGRFFLLTHRTKSKCRHIVDKYFSNLCFFSQNLKCENLSSYWNELEIDKNKFHFNKNSSHIKIGIVPATTNERKKYSDENYIKLVRLLLNHENFDIYIIGKKDAIKTSNRLLSEINDNRLYSIIGLTANLSELTYVLNKMDVVIGSDTGPLHIANALNVPNIFLFGASPFEKTGPYNKEKSIVLFPLINNYHKLKGSINKIEPKTVYDSVIKLLD